MYYCYLQPLDCVGRIFCYIGGTGDLSSYNPSSAIQALKFNAKVNLFYITYSRVLIANWLTSLSFIIA